MQISIIGCPFQTSYGVYIDSLKAALERKPGNKVQWVGSNCGCGDPIEVGRLFQTRKCDYFEMHNISDFVSKSPWKRWLRVKARHASYYFRARRYAELSRDSEVAHFQQILNAFGSSSVFHWLNQPSKAAKIVTIHEFDSYQKEFPEQNKIYNSADALIVHCQEMREKLIGMGIPKEKAHVVLQGVDIPALDRTGHREGIVFYGGHKPMAGKGMQPLFKAMAIIKERLGAATPLLSVHGHYGTNTPEEAIKLAQQTGIADQIVWLNQLPIQEMTHLYQKSLCLVLPYVGSFAGLPVAIAAANELPIVCTKNAGIPDHIGKWGLWVEEENPQQLAEGILEILGNAQLRMEVSSGLRKQAEEVLSWDV
ncbi:MAG: glycosyltransferase family 4 protein, partial [Candidatus Acidiferrum sp.]